MIRESCVNSISCARYCCTCVVNHITINCWFHTYRVKLSWIPKWVQINFNLYFIICCDYRNKPSIPSSGLNSICRNFSSEEVVSNYWITKGVNTTRLLRYCLSYNWWEFTICPTWIIQVQVHITIESRLTLWWLRSISKSKEIWSIWIHIRTNCRRSWNGLYE